MNKLICMIVTLCMAAAAVAQDEIVVETLLADGSTNTWTKAELVAAFGLVNRLYHREIDTPAGRIKWHGKLVKQIIDKDTGTKTEIYSDGSRFEFPFRVVSVTNRNERLKTTVNVKGIPTKLAEARLRRQAEKATTNIVNVVITPTKE